MRKRRKIVLVSLSAAIVVTILGILQLAQTTPQALEPASPVTAPPSEIPKDLFVVPEVPFGTIAVLLAMFSALLIALLRSKKKLLQT